ncbi:hypothetical protein F4861DRAFT_322633 [Xylaria intraflava]|nr:hypothetical protein F4861DRAFT_322633 [Xylaria intraflava]
MAEADAKSSRHKLATGAKKRHRDSTHVDGNERKHKRSKSHAVSPPDQDADDAVDGSQPTSKTSDGKKSKKSKKLKDSHASTERLQDEMPSDADEDGKAAERKRTSKKESRKKKTSYDESLHETTTQDPAVVVLKSSPSSTLPDGKPSRGNQYPFYTQTVSQYLPLRPLGISEPVQGYANQHLKPLLHRHVPSFGGVLLAYRNPRIGEAPGKASLTEDSNMEDMALLESVNEYAVSFGWLTAEIDLFRPARGVWLEGLVNFQGEGHIGLVCWGKFNASIESGRLPRDWRWIDHLGSSETKGKTSEETPAALPSPPEDGAEEDHTQVHATGYWIDKQGARIASDTPICFRIKNYEVGSSGDYGYLSIEGTMLPEEEEAKKIREEVRNLRHRIRHGSALRRERRPLLELSMTRFTNDDEREPEARPTEL